MVETADYLYALDTHNGELVWKIPFEDPVNLSIIEDQIYVMEGFKRVIHAIEGQTGVELGNMKVSFSPLLLTDYHDMASIGSLLVFAKGKSLFAYGK